MTLHKNLKAMTLSLFLGLPFLTTMSAAASATTVYQPTPQEISFKQIFSLDAVKHNPGTTLLISIAMFTLFQYKNTMPHEAPDQYDLTLLQQALMNLVRGRNIQASLTTIKEQLYYLYKDGLIGHSYLKTSPKFNEKTGLIEAPAIEPRGIFGIAGYYLETVLATLKAPADLASMAVAVVLLKTMFDNVGANGVAGLAKPSAGK